MTAVARPDSAVVAAFQRGMDLVDDYATGPRIVRRWPARWVDLDDEPGILVREDSDGTVSFRIPVDGPGLRHLTVRSAPVPEQVYGPPLVARAADLRPGDRFRGDRTRDSWSVVRSVSFFDDRATIRAWEDWPDTEGVYWLDRWAELTIERPAPGAAS